MNVLILGRDRTLFEAEPATASDTRERHRLYARVLRERFGAASSIRVISYTPVSAAHRIEQLPEGLGLYPTRSLHRATFVTGILARLARVLRRWRPALITAQTPWEEGTVGHHLGRLLGVPFLPQLHFDLFSREWRREHWLNRWRYRVACRRIRRAAGVRVVSHHLRREVERRLGVPGSRIFVLPVGVNFHPLDAASAAGGKDGLKREIAPDVAGKPVVLFVGRFYEPKDLPLWVRVAATVSGRLPEARFALAGEGPLVGAVKRLIEATGLGDRFHLLDGVSRQVLPRVYAAADVFLLTSRYEGYGRVVVESLLSGVPVVSTDCTGPRDLMEDGVHGYIRPREDAGALAGAVLSLLENPDRARHMGAAGRSRMEALHSPERLARGLIDCWATTAGVQRAGVAG